MTTAKRPIAIDLFSGCGGLTLGLKEAGFNVAVAIEMDPFAASCYQANHPEVSLFVKDIRQVSVKDIRRILGGAPSLVVGCPPCQGFSRIRTRNAPNATKEVQNSLYLEFLRIVKGLRPTAVMVENVPMFGSGSRFRRLCSELRGYGYKIAHAIVDAANFGVPQRRQRFILVGTLRENIPRIAENCTDRVTVKIALSSLSVKFLRNDPLHNLPQNFSAEVMARIRAIPKNGGNRHALSKNQTLRCHRLTHGRRDGFFDVYGRMRWDDVAPTITGGVYTPSKGRFLHPDENRCISLREAAVLQSFPSSYSFPIGIGKMRLASIIGNAIPPEFARRQAESLRKILEIPPAQDAQGRKHR